MTGPLVCVGAIAGAFGVRGEVRLKSFCAEPAAIAGYAPLATEDGSREFEVRAMRPVKGGFAVRLTGVATREEAEGLKGIRLYVPRARLPALSDEEYYHADLIGLAAVDPGGAEIGWIRAVHDHGAGDILEITRSADQRALLLPFTRDAVPTVDLVAGRVIVDPPQETMVQPGEDGTAEEA